MSETRELRDKLGVTEDEVERLRAQFLGAYPKLSSTLQRISPSKDGGVKGAKIAQIIMDDVEPVPVDVNVDIDFSQVERSLAERLIEEMGVPEHVLMAGRRGGKVRSLRRSIVEGSGFKPEAASWYPLTDDEVEEEYDTMVEEGRVKVFDKSVSLPLMTVHDSIEIVDPIGTLASYSEADVEATRRLYERLRSSDDEPE